MLSANSVLPNVSSVGRPEGFKIENTYDYGRTFKPKISFEGHKDPGNIYRPIQISIWYPAQRSAGAAQMLEKEYVDAIAFELGAGQATEQKMLAARDEFRRNLGPILAGQPSSDDQMDRILNTKTAAIRDCAPEPGPFPLIMNIPFGTRGQSVISEYLASHGYVVASIPMIGSDPSTRQFFRNRLIDVEAMIGDLEFVGRRMRESKQVDPDKVAVIGGMAGIAGVGFQMKNMNLDAIVGLESAFSDLVKQLPYFDPAKLRIPILHLGSKDNDAFSPERTLHLAIFADRYSVRFKELDHIQTYAFGMIAMSASSKARLGYELICEYTLSFLDAFVKGDDRGRAFLDRPPNGRGLPEGFLSIDHKSAMQPVPTEDEFLTLSQSPDGIRSAISLYWEIKRRDPRYAIFKQSTISSEGNRLRYSGNVKGSIELFKLEVDAYPNSALAANDLGNAFMQDGQKDEALKWFEKALELLPNDPDIPPKDQGPNRGIIQQKVDNLRKDFRGSLSLTIRTKERMTGAPAMCSYRKPRPFMLPLVLAWCQPR
jgi:tetratricopeptide (TPR) repeat protein